MFEERLTDKLIVEANQRVKERDYWLSKLSGEWVKTHFHYDYFMKAPHLGEQYEQTKTTREVTFRFEGELFEQLMKLSNAADFRLHMILVAALVILLHKYTGQKDIIVGSPIDKQEVEVDFINTVLPLRSQIEKSMTFKNLLLQVRQTIVEASDNQNYPMEVLIDKLNLPASGGAFPLFDTAILVKNIHDKRYLQHIQLNMMFSFLRTEKNIEGTVEYNPLLYKKETIERIIGHLRQLYTKVLFNVDLPVFEIDILTREERKCLLFEFNDNEADFPADKTVYQFIEAHGKKTPDRVAISFDGNQLTYQKLNQRANQLGRVLRESGIRQDKPLGVLLDRSPLMVESILATWESGGAYIPIETDYPYKRILEILDDSKADVLLTESHYVDSRLELGYQGKKIMLDSWSPAAVNQGGTAANLEPACDMNGLAYVIYTSGSTGKPKGAMVEHMGMMNHIHAKINDLQLTEKSIIAQNATHTFDISVWQFFAALTLGGKTVIYPHSTILEPAWFTTGLIDNRVTILEVVPSYLLVLLEFLPGVETAVPLSLEYLVVTGEELKPHLVKKWFEKFSNIKVVNAYGPTEASDDITHYIMDKAPGLARIPIGSPLQNFDIYIVDEQMKLCPIEVVGEICVSGPGVGRGYLNNPELTADKFVNHRSYRSHKSYPTYLSYKTGDLGRWLADGSIDFLGRKDYQVKIRGFRIELGEIENLLIKHPGIKEAAVIDRKDQHGNKYLCAYIVPIGTGDGNDWPAADSRENPKAELREYLRKKLPDYMVPAHFVKLERIPLTANGKVYRKALPEPAGQKDSITSPTNKLEKEILDTWSEVLAIDKNKISTDINFFELGGHSLKAIEMTSKLHKKMNIKIPLAEAFKAQTIRQLAAYIEKTAIDKYASIEPVEKKEYYALSSAQRRMLILNRLDPGSTAYNMPQIIPLREEPDAERLEKTFKKLVNRHESLRTSFHMVGNQLVQRIHDTVEFEIRRPSAAAGKNDLTTEDIETFSIDNFKRPFDLSRPPLARVELIHTPPSRHPSQKGTSTSKHLLLVDIHHIISDGVSHYVLQQDFMALYQNRELPALRLQYKDFSQWQNNHKEKENIKQQEEYWLKNFDGEIPILNIFYDYPRLATQSFAGSSLDFEVSAENTAALKNIALKENTTLYMILLAVFNVLFSKLGSQEDVVIGSSIEGRRHADLEKIIGMFINTLAMRNYPKAEKTFIEFLKDVKERTLEAFENQEYQFEDLVEKLAVKRDPARNPLFDVMFDLQNYIGTSSLEEPDTEEQKEYYYESRVAKFDITLAAMEVGGKLHFSFNFCTRLFKPETIKRIIDYFKKIITIIIEEPGIPLGQLQIIPEKEKEKLLYDFNNTGTGYPNHKTIHQLFEEQAARNPGKIALLSRWQVTGDKEENTSVTYGKLNRQSNQLAHLLKDRGIKPETIVGLLVEPSLEMVVGILAIWKAGGSYTLIDSAVTMKQIKAILTDSQLNVLLTTSNCFPRLNEFYREIAPCSNLESVIYLDTLGDMEMRERLFGTFRISSLLTGKTSGPKPRAHWLHYENQTLSYQQYMAKVANINDFISRGELLRESTSTVGIMFDNPIYNIIVALSLETLNIPFTVIAANLVKREKVRIINDSTIVTIFSQCSFLDELDQILWESPCLKSYILLDDYDFRNSSKEADFGKIWDYIAEESSEAINDYGWTDSYTNEPFTIDEMNQYIENFKVKLQPYLERSSRVLEIGCGHGLVLFEIAPGVSYYLATDLSPVIIAKNQKRVVRENLDNVEFQAAAASGISDLKEKEFDLIICSSVVHYFPNTLYLEKVITDAIDLLADQGIIYLDDLLDLGKKQELIRSTAEYKKMNPEARVKVDWDGDLFVSDDFFHDLQLKYPEITQWQSSRKIGPVKNELTRFRRDVLLKINKRNKNTPGSLSLLKKNRYTPRDIESSVFTGTFPAAVTGNRDSMESAGPVWTGGHIADKSTIKTYAEENPHQHIRLSDISQVIYTPGTAGKPKGVMVEHIGMMNHIQAKTNDLQLTSQSIVPQNAYRFTDISLWQFFAALTVGGKTLIYPGEPGLDPGSYISLLTKDNVTVLEVVPSYLTVMLEFLHLKNRPMESLRYLLVRGETLEPPLVKKWFETYPGIKMVYAYGPTELSDDSTHHIMERPPDRERVPIGKPLQNLDIYIVDEYMNLCPIGVNGEICVSGVGLCRGYLNDGLKTKQAFTQYPFAREKGVPLYKTGDIGCWLPDGNIEFFGRINGKVDRKPLPPPEAGPSIEEYVPPGNEVEETLLGICQEVLGAAQIGITDNFFLVGGDSIKAIQIAARLKKYRLELRINDIFLHPVLKELSIYVTRTDRIIHQGIVAGEVALTPIQRWFWKHNLIAKHHINQAVMLYRETGFDEKILKKVFTKIAEHHDALRMVYDFQENTANVIQRNRGLKGELFDFEIIDLQDTPDENIPGAVGKETHRIHQGIDLKTGPLVKLAIFRTSGGDHLLIVINHLVIDGVSWRILLEDFSTGYRQVMQGEDITFPEKTDSYLSWSQKLVEYAAGADSEGSEIRDVLKEWSYWREVEAIAIEPLPRDYQITAAKKKVKHMEAFNMRLEEEGTERLLRNVNRAYNTEINDILLTALGLTIHQWAGIERVLISLEGHGRESVIKGIDINRTVGCFTTIYPVVLDMKHPACQDLSYAIRWVKETLRRIPNNGIGYGILKYLTPPGKKQGLRFKHEPEISFNYLGQVGQESGNNKQLGKQDRDPFIRFSPLKKRGAISGELEQIYAIDINGMMVDSSLEFSFTYNKYEYDRNRIKTLVDRYKANLLKIIEHCMNREGSEFTPSDTGYIGIDIDDFEELEMELSDID